MANWYSDTKLVSELGQVLVDAEILEDTDDFKAFLAEPYRYDEFYEAWKEADYPNIESDNWDSFVDQITPDDDETTDETEPE